nr:ATP-dependent helicase [Actinomyces sp. UMB0138]
MNKGEEVLAEAVAVLGGVPRDGQTQMANAIWDLSRDQVLLVQAGTGTGKSLGYLAPLLTEAVEESRRVVISTATLILQRQLVGGDIPAVQKAVKKVLGKAPRIALLKGWTNYVCKLKTMAPEDQAGLFDELEVTATGAEVLRIREWAEETSTGDRDDMSPGVTDKIWRGVSVTKTECVGESCPFATECFPRNARKAAAEADVVVTNHSILGVQAMTEAELLGEFDVLVVDEAHELDGRIRSQGTVEISDASLLRLARLARRATGVPAAKIEEAASALAQGLKESVSGRIKALPSGLHGALVSAGSAMRDALETIGDGKENSDNKKRVARAELISAIDSIDAILIDDPAVRVNWITEDAEGRRRLCSAPLDVARPIASRLYGNHKVVATSATLCLGNSFDAMANRLGAQLAGTWKGLDVGSPFDYPHQAIMYIPQLPQPGRDGPSPQLLAEIGELVKASGGGALCLFTSRRAAQLGGEYLREHTDLPVFVQGEDYLPSLIKAFREDGNAVLAGTISLWQGVDIPGPACRLVTIDRIPFPRPDDPITSALSDAANAAGRSGFTGVSLVHAALLLAQGAGRLVRTSSDKGMVALLDPRLYSKGYGRFLLSSLPKMWPTRSQEVAVGALARLKDNVGL